MSILRVVCNPADEPSAGYDFLSSEAGVFDSERVEGYFQFMGQQAMHVNHPAASGDETWYHFRMAGSQGGSSYTFETTAVIIEDENSNTLAVLAVDDSQPRVHLYNGNTTASGARTPWAAKAAYSMDMQVVRTDTDLTLRWYINSALYADLALTNDNSFGVPVRVVFQCTDGDQYIAVSEVLIADEDTRGMRVREMRPKSFGIYQEWDGHVSSLRDSDLATGISTELTDRRVSFGITNVENVEPGDIINRVICQTYAQRGENGIPKFNHFFRFRDGGLEDGADFTLGDLGDYFIEEFQLNPQTGLAWQPDDFKSLQSGIRSRPA